MDSSLYCKRLFLNTFLLLTQIRLSYSMGDTHHIFFKKVGESVFRLEFANVEIGIDVAATLEEVSRLKKELQTNRFKMGQYNRKMKVKRYRETPTWQKAEFNIMEVDRLKNRLLRLYQVKDEVPRQPRIHKRFIGMVVAAVIALTVFAGTVAASVYGATYTNQEVASMATNVNTLSATQVATIRQVQHQAESHGELERFVGEVAKITERGFSQLAATGWDRAAIDIAARRVTMQEQAIAGMLQGRLVPAALNDVDIKKTSTDIAKYAAVQGMRPLAKFFTDYLQMETSFFSSDEGYKLFLHIPLMQLGTELRVFRHARVPIPVGHGYQVTVESEKEFIAISNDNSFYRTMTANELAECGRKGDFFFCKVGNVVRRAPLKLTGNFGKDPDLCLWALFTQNNHIAVQVCTVYVASAPDSVLQLSPTRFIAFNEKPHQARMECRNNSISHKKRFAVKGVTDIHVPAGCSVTTETHVFAASDVAFTRPADNWAVEYTWPHNKEHLLQGLDLERLRVISASSLTLANATRIPLEHALDAVKKLKPVQLVQGGYLFDWIPHGGLGITFLLALSSFMLTLWHICRHKPKDTINHDYARAVYTPSAPLQLAIDDLYSPQCRKK